VGLSHPDLAEMTAGHFCPSQTEFDPMPQKKPDLASIAAHLTGGPPLSYHCYPDNTLVVITHEGKKRRFSFNEYKSLLKLKGPQAPSGDGPKPKKPPSAKKK
jgi:hypothetical protein